MTAWLQRGACVALAFALCALGCGGAAPQPLAGMSGVSAAASPDWPAVAELPPDAIDVSAALASEEGAQIRVRAKLVAVTLPCPACNAGERRETAPAPKVGASPRPTPRTMPGCLPCPSPAATFRDDTTSAAATPSAPLRAVGVAEGLQGRHVGSEFVITGTFHASGPGGPELDVSDVRALGP